jgi:hypothetical protein
MQFAAALRKDVPNLHPKVLIDLLHRRGVTGGRGRPAIPGLAIIEDDRVRVVPFDARGYQESDRTSVVLTYMHRGALNGERALQLLLEGKITAMGHHGQ